MVSQPSLTAQAGGWFFPFLAQTRLYILEFRMLQYMITATHPSSTAYDSSHPPFVISSPDIVPAFLPARPKNNHTAPWVAKGTCSQGSVAG